MNTEHQEHLANTESSRWPACPMLLWGTFGTKTPAERRYLSRVLKGAAVFVGWVLFAFAAHLPRPVIGSITSVAVGALVTYIAWELRRYLLVLDELARRMQLEAMAWTYLTGLVVAAWLGALLSFNHTLLHWHIGEMLLLLSPFLYFLLEVVRSWWLYYLSRRY